MLNIIFGECKDVIYNTSVFFKNVYEKEWLNEEQTRQKIRILDSIFSKIYLMENILASQRKVNQTSLII